MPVMRVRIADTEAIAKYYPTYKGVRLHKIVTVNHNGKGRRPIRLDQENQTRLEAIIYEGTQVNVAAPNITATTSATVSAIAA